MSRANVTGCCQMLYPKTQVGTQKEEKQSSSRCVNCFVLRPQGVANCWRREQDLNLRRLLTSHAFQACALSRSTISPTYFKCNCTLLINNTKKCKNSQMILGTFLFLLCFYPIICRKMKPAKYY